MDRSASRRFVAGGDGSTRVPPLQPDCERRELGLERADSLLYVVAQPERTLACPQADADTGHRRTTRAKCPFGLRHSRPVSRRPRQARARRVAEGQSRHACRQPAVIIAAPQRATPNRCVARRARAGRARERPSRRVERREHETMLRSPRRRERTACSRRRRRVPPRDAEDARRTHDAPTTSARGSSSDVPRAVATAYGTLSSAARSAKTK